MARKYFPKPLKNPVPVGFMGRKIGRMFRETTLETWKKVIPPERYKIRGRPEEIIIADRVKIVTGGLDRQETINQFNSAELAFAFVDQAEETVKDDILLLRAATFNRLLLKGEQQAGKILWTANPANCWLQPDFITGEKSSSKCFVQALPSDNPYLGQAYVNTLRETFKHRPELLEAYLHGNWDQMEGAEQIIKGKWLREASERIARPVYIKKYLVCDPARFGDDECVIYRMENTEIEEKVVLPYCRTTDISNRLATMSTQTGDCPIVVESVGADLGAGVVDELAQMGKHVIVFNPAGASMYPEKYVNLRAEAWNEAAKMLAAGVVDTQTNQVVTFKSVYEDLRTQLCSPTHKFRNGKLQVESKADIKTRLGRSPDHADTYIIALWALPQIEAVSYTDWENRRSPSQREMARNPMDM